MGKHHKSKYDAVQDDWCNNLPKEVKKKIFGMKIKIFLFWAALLSILLFAGCITKPAKKLVGIVPTEHGTWQLQSAADRQKREAAAEKAKEEAREKALAERPKLKAAKTKPKHTPQSAKPTNIPHGISGVGEATPFSPTIKEAKLSPSQALIKMGEKEESNRVKPIVLQEASNVIVDKPNDSATNVPTEHPPIKVKWGSLFLYYILAAFVLGWLGFKYKHLILNRNEKPKKRNKRVHK